VRYTTLTRRCREISPGKSLEFGDDLALCDAVAQGRVRQGDTLVFAAFGGGMTWGAAVVEWTRV